MSNIYKIQRHSQYDTSAITHDHFHIYIIRKYSMHDMFIVFHDFVYRYCFWNFFVSIFYTSVVSNYLGHSIGGSHTPFVSIFIPKVFITRFMETSDMWHILPVWNNEASTKMSSQRKSESAIIQRNPIGNREFVGVLRHCPQRQQLHRIPSLILKAMMTFLLQLLIVQEKLLLLIILLITPGCRWTTWFHIMYVLIVWTNKYMTN